MAEHSEAVEPPASTPAKRPWSRWWLLVPAILVAFRVALPEIVRRAVESNAASAIHGQVTVGDVDLALWRGHVDLKEVAIRPATADAAPLVFIARLGLGLRYLPLLRKTVLLRAVEIEAPQVEAERLASGDINLLGLLPVAEEPEQPDAAVEPSSWKFGLDRLELSDGRLRFRDAMMGADAEPIEIHVGRIAIDDLAISPDVYGGPSRVHAAIALENGTIDVDGTLRMVDDEPALALKATARALPLRHARVYVPDVGWSDLSGALDLDLDYELDPGSKNLLRGRAALADVSVAVPGEDVAAAWKSFVVELDALDLLAQDAKVKKVELDGAVVSVKLDDDEMLPVLASGAKSAGARPQAANAANASPTPTVSPEPSPSPTPTPVAPKTSRAKKPAAPEPKPWTWRVEEARIVNSIVKLSEGGRPPVDVATTLDAGPLASDAATISPAKLTLAVANGSVVVDGRLRVADPAFGGRLAIDGVELAPLFAITDALPNDVVGSGTLRSDLAIAAGLPARDGEDAPVDRVRIAGSVDVASLRATPAGTDPLKLSLGSMALRVARLDLPGVVGPPPQPGASIDGDLDVELADAAFDRGGASPLAVAGKSLRLAASSLRVPARLAALGPADEASTGGAPAVGDGVEGDLTLRGTGLRGAVGKGAAEATARDLELALANVFVPLSPGAGRGAATRGAATLPPANAAAPETTPAADAATSDSLAPAANPEPGEGAAGPAPADAAKPAPPAPAAALDPGRTPGLVLLASSRPLRVIPVASTARASARGPVASKPRSAARPAARPAQRPGSVSPRRSGGPSGRAIASPSTPAPRLLPQRPARRVGSSLPNVARMDAKLEIRGLEAKTAGGRELRAVADAILLRLDEVLAPGVFADAAPSATADALHASGLLEIASPRAARGDGGDFSFAARALAVPATDVVLPGSLGGLPPGAAAQPLQVALGDVRLDGPAVRATRTLAGFVLPDVSLSGEPPASARSAEAGGRIESVRTGRRGERGGQGAAAVAPKVPAPATPPSAANVATAQRGSPTAAAAPAPAGVPTSESPPAEPAATTATATAADTNTAAAPTTTTRTPTTAAATPTTTTPTSATATTATPPAPPPAFSLRADAIRVSGGRLDLVDRTLTPAVATIVDPIELDARQVRIPGPSARPLKLDMTLPGRGRVRIDGELAPGASVIRTNVDGLAIAPFNPYVAAASAYSIAEGALTISSVARENRNLWTVSNDVTLHRLKLAGADGASLFQQTFGMPVETAMALLRDVRGDISLGVPFTVDESGGAQVHVASIVASALRQALMGAILSPLKMLGSIVGAGGGGAGGSGGAAGAEGPAAVAFAAGRDVPTESGRAMIDRVGELLASRPGLGVRLSAAPSEEDARVLREQSVVEAWKSEGPLRRLAADTDQRERIGAWLEARARGETAELSKDDRAAFDQAVAKQPAAAAPALRALAEARLAAVESALRDRGVASDRVARDAIPATPVAGVPSVATQLQPLGGAPLPASLPAQATGSTTSPTAATTADAAAVPTATGSAGDSPSRVPPGRAPSRRAR
ncbi:DUF748 domain-containing protein [bacterium]|nr:DUF748 domain-containing protein [bacterium]